MSGALPNRSTTSVSRRQRDPKSNRTKNVTIKAAPPAPREIQPQHQNWLARFLRIKPAVSILCFHTSRVRARKEITGVFREWRKYGMKDIVIDKTAGRIWGRVAVKNCKFCYTPLTAFFFIRCSFKTYTLGFFLSLLHLP